MLFRIRLAYSVHVDASDSAEAFRKACKALQEQPGSHIASVEQAATPKEKGSLLRRIVTGR